jgi:hypothetical protein
MSDKGKQEIWRERMSSPVAGMKRWRRNPGCYGACCGEGTKSGYLCTVCRRYDSFAKVCCGYNTVKVSPRIHVPPVHAKGRWKLFLKRFPRFQFREELKYVPDEELEA